MPEATPISEDSDIVSIAEFCMNLYKLQLEMPKSALSEIVPIKPRSDNPDQVYELHVEREGNWVSRRMAIATLGEGSGSKSRCFKVIYDNLLVVKIPPSPMTDFDEYVRSIRVEGSIAVKLAASIEFVAPGVTAILKKICPFDDAAELSPARLEKRYVRWVQENPDFQEYLKINDAFVFFMDLSKNSFLSFIVGNMHDRRVFKRKIHDDIIESRNLLWDILEFEGKYGSENLSIYFDMNKVYSDYETRIRALLKQYGTMFSVSPYEKQKWFLIYLARKEVNPGENTQPPDFFEELNKLLRKTMKENWSHVKAYKRAVRDYIRRSAFIQNRSRMAGIVTNIVRLLASLRERGVAIRDLKPDNLFIVGDSVRTAKDYSLGLIDFETSVVFKTNSEIDQPMLAGTPSYSTPSHLFKNEVLRHVFGDLPPVLHFQDWHAVIAMIYNVATGDRLFEDTKKLLPKISRTARKFTAKNQPLNDMFRKSSQIFWRSALAEFRKKLGLNEDILRAVEVDIPENARKMFLNDILRDKKDILERIRRKVASQTIFGSSDSRKNLLRSSPEKIIQYRIKWEKGGISGTSPELREKIMKFLRELEYLKLMLGKQEQTIKILGFSHPRMSAYELLEFMFDIVLHTMYREDWGYLSYAQDEDIQNEEFGDTTIVYEDTISFE